MKIGFIGLGAMGLPMCSNLSRHFDSVLAYDTSQKARELAQEQDIQVVPCLTQLRGLDVLVTMLPDGKRVQSCLLPQAEDGVAPVTLILKSQGVVIDMSSSSALDSVNLAQALDRLGFGFADAPVSGSVPKARSGTLSIMLGASDAIASKIEPVLMAMGTAVIRTGAVGTAHAMKTLNNYVYAAGLLAATEAMLMGQALGLDLEKLVDVFNSSSGRNVATETKLKQHMLKDGQLGAGDLKGGFGLHLMAKDLDIGFGLQASTGFAPEQLALCHQIWQQAAKEIQPGADNLEIMRFLENRYVAKE